jgi:hypothetical protein
MLSYQQIMAKLMLRDDFKGLSDSHKTNVIQRLGFTSDLTRLSVDGKLGPKTLGGKFLDIDLITTPAAKIALNELVAMSQEVGGSNMGPFVQKYFRMKKLPTKNAGAFCAGGASYCLREGYPGEGTPYLLGAQRLGRAVAAKGAGQHSIQHAKPDDLLIWNRETSTPGTGHVEVTVHVTDDIVFTIGFNVGRYPAPTRVFINKKSDPSRGKGNEFLFCARWKK